MVDPLEWCRERMLRRGSPLSASLPFAPESLRDAILALRTLVSEIAAVPDTVSDADVGRKKLAWWRQALEDRAAHPAIEALVASGAADRLPADRFAPLITHVAETLDSPRFELNEAAWRHCLALGGPMAELEAELLGGRPALEFDWAALGGFAYLVRLVRDLGIDARNNRWLVPLDLQAEYQLGRQDVVSGSPGRGWEGMVRAWLEDGLRRTDAALRDLAPDQGWRQRHLLITHALDRRLAVGLARRPRRILRGRPQPGHVGNVWCAWRAARRLRREAARARLSPN
jgi:phytoene/squalene synthetase